MGWFNRVRTWLRRDRPVPPPRRRRFVVVSDLHMGEEVGEGDAPFLEYIAALNREFSAFIEHQRHRATDPTTLIINGDSIDFIRTLLHPNPIEARLIDAQTLSPREARLGLDSSRPHAVWKLGRVIGFHRPIFEALSRFVVAGNELVVIRGNHDVELYWPEVRQAIVDTLAEMAGVDSADILPRVRFEPWFYLRPGLLYVEHGHQYDPHCSYTDLLDPVEGEGRSIALPYAVWSIRYFAPLLHGMPAAEMEDWGLFDFFRFALKQPLSRFIGAVVAYLRMVVDALVRRSWRSTVGPTRARARHRRRLGAVAEQAGLPLRQVERLDALKETPVEERFMGVTLAFYVDRFLLLFLTTVGVLISLLVPGTWVWRTVGALGTLLVAILLHEVLRRIRTFEATPRLTQKAIEIARLLEVPFVCFGHSHDAEIHPEEGLDRLPRRFYLNSGHWVPRYPKTAYSYIEISGDPATPVARLLRWRGATEVPIEIDRACPIGGALAASAESPPRAR